MDGMIIRKWTNKSSKKPTKIAGQCPLVYAHTGRRHAPNEPDRSDQGTSATRAGAAGDCRLAPEPKPAQPKLAAVKTRPNAPKYIPPPEHPWRHMTFGAGHAR